MLDKLKNWALPLVGIILLVLDAGFDIINPLLVELELEPKVISIIKVIFGIYGLVKLKQALPTGNPEKLQDLVDKANSK